MHNASLIPPFLMLAMSLSAMPATADSDGLTKCAAISEADLRLSCFDALAGTPGAGDKQDSVGEWQTETQKSKIDDSTNVSIWHAAKAPVKDRFGRNKYPQVTVACVEGHTNFYFTVDGMFLADSGGFGDVVVRLDKAKARTLPMLESTDHTALGLWQGAGVKLIKQMAAAANAVVVMTPFNESQVTFEIDLTGMATALKPLRKSCGW